MTRRVEPVNLSAAAEEFDDEPTDGEAGAVIPFGIFDARAEAERWP
jgi:hypothetical protein